MTMKDLLDTMQYVIWPHPQGFVGNGKAHFPSDAPRTAKFLVVNSEIVLMDLVRSWNTSKRFLEDLREERPTMLVIRKQNTAIEIFPNIYLQ